LNSDVAPATTRNLEKHQQPGFVVGVANILCQEHDGPGRKRVPIPLYINLFNYTNLTLHYQKTKSKIKIKLEKIK
jgi:hypothetical protein